MRTVTVQAGVTIDLGHQYDNYATEVVFPSAIIDPFITNFGSSGTFAIWYRRSGDSLGYPIGSPLVTFDSTNSEVTWDVVESDTASPGVSQVQLRYIVDEVCVMSQIFAGNVADSVDTGTEVPEPMEQWADAIVSAGAGGQPTVATSVSAMADHNTIYLYTGSESGYTNGHIYYWNGSAWTDGGAYGGGSSSGGPGLTDDIKQALLDCFDHVAWTDEHGQDYVDALEAALYPPAELASISAVYTQSGTVYTTDSLNDLKSDLVVTAYYTDSTTETVTTYTLSGTLTEGTSVITVSYGGKTTTFNVTVTAPATLSSITAVYTQSGTVYDTDSLDSLKSDLVVTAVYSDSTTEVVTDYTLSGTLTEGTSTITVSYGGKTTTFTVTVTEWQPITQTITWSGGGADKTSSIIDATQYDAYYELPFDAESTKIIAGTTASTSAYTAYDTYLYSDASATNLVGRYQIDTGIIAETGRPGGSCPIVAFDTKIKVAPSGYYVKILLNKRPEAFESNANFKSYLDANGTTVTLE